MGEREEGGRVRGDVGMKVMQGSKGEAEERRGEEGGAKGKGKGMRKADMREEKATKGNKEGMRKGKGEKVVATGGKGWNSMK